MGIRYMNYYEMCNSERYNSLFRSRFKKNKQPTAKNTTKTEKYYF